MERGKHGTGKPSVTSVVTAVTGFHNFGAVGFEPLMPLEVSLAKSPFFVLGFDKVFI
jgi:hypothetical protein